ncbi:MAG: DUF3429 domain-containing protein [Hyphomonadaceae bacterium]|nr:DUF3429 domain-containing protein [Hyphomonadaceae bacterium]
MLRSGAFAIPPAPLALTIAGLMPFVGGALACWALEGDIARQAAAYLTLLTYGAVVLSFLGGVRWGVEMSDAMLTPPRWGVMSAAILGALIGWALVLYYVLGAPSPWVFPIMAAAFAGHWLWDVLSRKALPVWYDGLRTIASVGAVLSLLAAWATTGPAALF